MDPNALAVFIGAISGIISGGATAVAVMWKQRFDLRQAARKDALAEWQGLYAEKSKEVAELKDEVNALRAQNAAQQKEIDDLKDKHATCERQQAEMRAKLAELETRVK